MSATWTTSAEVGGECRGGRSALPTRVYSVGFGALILRPASTVLSAPQPKLLSGVRGPLS